MKSITERLRDAKYVMFFDGWTSSIVAIEAADRIEKLERENAELRHDIERHVAICAELANEPHLREEE